MGPSEKRSSVRKRSGNRKTPSTGQHEGVRPAEKHSGIRDSCQASAGACVPALLRVSGGCSRRFSGIDDNLVSRSSLLGAKIVDYCAPNRSVASQKRPLPTLNFETPVHRFIHISRVSFKGFSLTFPCNNRRFFVLGKRSAATKRGRASKSFEGTASPTESGIGCRTCREPRI